MHDKETLLCQFALIFMATKFYFNNIFLAFTVLIHETFTNIIMVYFANSKLYKIWLMWIMVFDVVFIVFVGLETKYNYVPNSISLVQGTLNSN